MGPVQHQLPQPNTGRAPSTAADRQTDAPPAWAYMVRCADGSLYSGWTNNLARRLRAHKTGQGARYTRMRGGARLAYAELCAGKSAALKREAALKRLDKAEKEALAARWAAENRVTLRFATPEDAPAVVRLYNWYVTHDTATYQYTPSTPGEYRRLIADTLQSAPFLLAETPGGQLLGYACAHPWHTRGAFAWDVETTIYCAPLAVGLGVGNRLYTALLALLKAQGYYNAIALIAHPNPASEAFHRHFGFQRYGLEPRTGYKFGRWLGLGYWRLALHSGTGQPAPVRLALPPEEAAQILAQGETTP